MLAALIVVAVIAILVILVLSAADQGAARVRARRHLPARPPARQAQGARPDLPHPDRRQDGPGRPADDHADDPAAGSDHEGQRAGARERRLLLPRRRCIGLGRAGGELHGGHVAGRADDAALGARPALARRAPVRAREDQLDPPGDHRRDNGSLGHQGLDRRGQGRRDPRRHAARDGTSGRGRARAAGEDHQRGGRVPGRRAAHGSGGRDGKGSDRAPAPLPPDAARDRLRQQLDDRLPRAHRPAQAVPRAHRPGEGARAERRGARAAPRPAVRPPRGGRPRTRQAAGSVSEARAAA